jgi:hypothetical protein
LGKSLMIHKFLLLKMEEGYISQGGSVNGELGSDVAILLHPHNLTAFRKPTSQDFG